MLQPDIIWFREIRYHLEEIDQTPGDVKVFLSIKISGHVYPVAGSFERACSDGAWCIKINKDQTEFSPHFDDKRIEPAAVEVPKLVDELFR